MPQDNSKELRDVLGAGFRKVFPHGLDGEVEKATFQSETFREAGYNTNPKRYGRGDGFLYTVKHVDGRMTFVVTGKIASGGFFEVGHAAWECLDLRGGMTVVYEFDGKGTITESQLGTRKKHTYEGEQGNPDVLLQFIAQALGKRVRG